MKPIYFVHASDYDGCNSWTADFCHCHNKKFIEDLVAKLNKKSGKNVEFVVCELKVLETPTKEQVNNMLEYHGFGYLNI